MKRTLYTSLPILAATLAATLLSPALAHADTFTITRAPGSTASAYTIVFYLPASPTTIIPNVAGGVFSIAANTYINGTYHPDDILTFYTASQGGGLTDNDTSFGPYGPQLFTGSVTAPTFTLGSFNLSNSSLGSPTDYILTTTAGTPEPSSLWLLGTGALSLAGAVRRRLLR